ncbi:MAG: 50S ribosomal protein L3 N(5)-glutamine methyltransferase [Candidimonas sp.]|nr:MAG: 50S ribosomal protein L3 N(5)-glutamine methyltransferase [Candidimonas sp.]
MSDPREALRTLRDLMRYAVSRFNEAKLAFGHGTDDAWDEAAYLLLHMLHLPLDTLDPFLDARILPDERTRFLELVERRVSERLPAAYLTGEAWLQGYRFIVDSRVIIPRSPIAECLAHGLSPWIANPDELHTVLDLCTGSGCLAILAALAFDNARVDATDLSEDALAVAHANIEQFGLEERITTYQGNLFDGLPGHQYDLIICNPPYVNARAMAMLPAEYRHEPSMALAGGEDGMDFVRRILRDAPDAMTADGLLMLEIGNEYDHFAAAFPNINPVWIATQSAENQILLLTHEELSAGGRSTP